MQTSLPIRWLPGFLKSRWQGNLFALQIHGSLFCRLFLGNVLTSSIQKICKAWLPFGKALAELSGYPMCIYLPTDSSLAWPGCLVEVSGFLITPLSHGVLLITLQFCDMEAALCKQFHIPVSSLSSTETPPGPRDLCLLFSSVLFLILSNLFIWDGASGAPPIKTLSMGNALSFSMINRCRKIISLLCSALIMLEHSFLLCLCCLLAVFTSSGRCPATAVSEKKIVTLFPSYSSKSSLWHF